MCSKNTFYDKCLAVVSVIAIAALFIAACTMLIVMYGITYEIIFIQRCKS